MQYKGCQRCNGDLWVEEDMRLHSQDLVCIQCGHHQTIQPALVGLNSEEQSGVTRWLMSERPSRGAPQALVT